MTGQGANYPKISLDINSKKEDFKMLTDKQIDDIVDLIEQAYEDGLNDGRDDNLGWDFHWYNQRGLVVDILNSEVDIIRRDLPA